MYVYATGSRKSKDLPNRYSRFDTLLSLCVPGHSTTGLLLLTGNEASNL